MQACCISSVYNADNKSGHVTRGREASVTVPLDTFAAQLFALFPENQCAHPGNSNDKSRGDQYKSDYLSGSVQHYERRYPIKQCRPTLQLKLSFGLRSRCSQ